MNRRYKSTKSNFQSIRPQGLRERKRRIFYFSWHFNIQNLDGMVVLLSSIVCPSNQTPFTLSANTYLLSISLAFVHMYILASYKYWLSWTAHKSDSSQWWAASLKCRQQGLSSADCGRDTARSTASDTHQSLNAKITLTEVTFVSSGSTELYAHWWCTHIWNM